MFCGVFSHPYINPTWIYKSWKSWLVCCAVTPWLFNFTNTDLSCECRKQKAKKLGLASRLLPPHKKGDTAE